MEGEYLSIFKKNCELQHTYRELYKTFIQLKWIIMNKRSDNQQLNQELKETSTLGSALCVRSLLS